MPGLLLTQQEAAEHLGVGVRTIRTLTRQGRIPVWHGQPGSHPKYPLPALDRYFTNIEPTTPGGQEPT